MDSIDFKKIKIVKNKKTKFYRNKIRELTTEFHYYLHNHFDYKMHLHEKRWIRTKDKNAYLIFYDNKPIGIISLKHQDNNYYIYLWRLYILEEYRNKGVGKYIIDFVKNNFKYEVIYLMVYKKNEESKKFYERKGFRIYTSDKENYYLEFRKRGDYD